VLVARAPRAAVPAVPAAKIEERFQEREQSEAIVDIATPLGISVHDHIIVCRGGSLKGMRFI
jgi:DNA repair protein RadC